MKKIDFWRSRCADKKNWCWWNAIPAERFSFLLFYVFFFAVFCWTSFSRYLDSCPGLYVASVLITWCTLTFLCLFQRNSKEKYPLTCAVGKMTSDYYHKSLTIRFYATNRFWEDVNSFGEAKERITRSMILSPDLLVHCEIYAATLFAESTCIWHP